MRNRKAAEQHLREEMAKHADMPALSVGAEVYFFRGISQTDILRELAIDGGKYVLVEMPHCDWTDTMYRELEEIYNRQGLVPIMAHIDRYLGPIGKNSIMKRLEALPVLVQVNASFFRSGGSARKALKMLKKGQIHLIGSDCHNTRERSPKLGEAVQVIEKHLGQPALNWICEHQNMVLDL